MLSLVLILTALALAFANGANDNFKAVATLYGSRSLSFEGGRAIATFAQLAGSFASIVLAERLLRTFSGKGLVPDAVVADPIFLVSVAGGAALTVWIATRVGLPISTTHALVGGLAGAGFALAPSSLSLSALGGSYFTPLLVSPLLALAASALVYPVAHQVRRKLDVRTDSCLCVGAVEEPVVAGPGGALVLARTGVELSVDEIARCEERYAGHFVGIRLQAWVDAIHRGSAFALGFARGLNDTPKVMALLVAAGVAGLPVPLALTGIALAMALGGFLRARRVAETLSRRITPLRHGQGVIANILSSSLVIGASIAGTPVSTTHVSTGALFGIGLWNRETNWSMVGGILASWVATLPLAALLAGVAASLLVAAPLPR